MPVTDDILDSSVVEIARRVRARTVSPVELAEAYLARIEREQPRLNAFVTVTRDVAIADARRAESEIAAGKYRGPLHGIPYGLKDLIDTQGIRTTFGAKPFADRVPDRDATIVRRLRDAGAVLLGKLSMIELAGTFGYRFANAAFNGPCRTPWDPTRWAGGSSSGAGAATAAGLVGFAIGSETWGSIVCPAAFCGVTGHRPTYGVVSRYGAMPLAYTLDKLGPFARTATDCALVLGAIAGRDSLDASTLDAPLGLAALRPERLVGTRVGVVEPAPFATMEPAAIEAFRAATAVLREMGAVVEETALPSLPFEATANVILESEGLAAFDDLVQSGRWRELADTSAWAKKMQRGAALATGADYVKAMRVRTELQRALGAMFDKYDVIVAPSFPVAPPRIDQDLEVYFKGFDDPIGAAGALAGLPAVSLPCGFFGTLPASFQIVGRPMDDARVLSIAAAYQGRTDWHLRRPAATPTVGSGY